MENIYDLGERVTITGEFTSSGELGDPAVVRVLYKNPSGSVTTITYPDPLITKEEIGKYSFKLDTDIAGRWYYRMDDGSENVAAEGQFVVKLSNLI